MNDIDTPLVKKHNNLPQIKTIMKEDMSNLNEWLSEFDQQTKLIEQELFSDLGFNNLSTDQIQEIRDYINSRDFASFEESKKILSKVFAHWLKIKHS